MEKVFKALADGTRRELLDLLSARQTLGELCKYMTMSRQAVTKHLLLLEEANLVTVVWQGREKLHYINPVPIEVIYQRWIGKFKRHRIEAINNLKQALEEESTHE
ncbi:ArsR/SmtB family transcription factor [Paenibacillus ferrarius]|uniref:ArsR/SmtB family transcription factor n=1 Tax=Paenibacillus ferrarius TaxID=1469647 RepID=UPI003D296311